MSIIIPSAVNFSRKIHELMDVLRLLFLPKTESNLPRYSFPSLEGKPRIAIKIINYFCHCILDDFPWDSRTANTTQRSLIERSSHFPSKLPHLARCTLIVVRLITKKKSNLRLKHKITTFGRPQEYASTLCARHCSRPEIE